MTKSIWFDQSPLGHEYEAPGLQKHLGIELTEAGPDWLKGRMPVDERTRQPFGRLHGGASVALAETLASVASVFVVDRSQKTIVGLEINANHLRGVTDGFVTGTARPLHIGRTTMVWEVRIEDEAGKAVCISRCTIAVIDLPREKV
ncbi:putative esterase [Beijerinckiaceae bacterium RH AL1]|jgi:1,4-dihydroxy-2-naphthoyl-CoA hydrolase|nr:hotdog fold thioesterase [Beijerinckiaceae bacterium]VVB43126.1 putative esterase [Beijerinckiaceae bacterium RH AL8]VVB43141.1 putative esterase [Beijerinckiaceae bacterium RH CH11]VVC53681.1 putative esterase [Beijerinckiaceae bacterium RH AL1]